MLLAPHGPRSVAAILGAAGAFGVVLWGAPLLFLPAGPSSLRGAILFLPSVIGTLALAFGCGVWVGRRRRSREDGSALAAGQSRLVMLQVQLRQATERAKAEERRIARLLETAGPGAALLDPGHRLLAWNRGFAALFEVPEHALLPGLSLTELVGLQPSGERRRLPLRGIEAGVSGAARRRRGDGSQVEDRWQPAPEGDVLLTCTPVAPARDEADESRVLTDELTALCEEEIRTRLPRLQDAIVAGDSAAARTEAHAIRGVAASFGLDALAAALAVVEAAAKAGDVARLTEAGRALPDLAEAALRKLARQTA